MQSKHVSVTVDLDRIRANAEAIKARTKVPLIAVVKADAYGHGAHAAADVLAGVAHEFAYFNLEEAAHLCQPGIVLGPPMGEPHEFADLRVRPTISTADEARRYGGIPCSIELDSGMQRFGCSVTELHEFVRTCRVQDVWSHCGNLQSVERMIAATCDLDLPRHASPTCLIDEPRAWLDRVRPGVALYRGALRVSTRLAVARDTYGPAGYTGFECPRVGILLAGYGVGIRPATVLVNGRPQRMLEVGMNCTYISLDRRDKAGDEVVLLGDGLPEAQLAEETNSREHEIMCRYGRIAPRKYVTARQILRRVPDTTRLIA